jgi:uncharacterized protein (TIGR00369 family)
MTELAGAALMRDFVPTSPFAALLGISVVELAQDRAVLALPDRPELATMGTTVHGGALATLLDTTAMAAAWCTDELPASQRGATAALTVTYLAPAVGEVRAVGQVLSRGRSLVTVEVAADCGGTPVARALVTYKIG